MAIIAAVAAIMPKSTAAIVAAVGSTQVSVCQTHNIVTQNVAAADAKLILPRMSSIESRS